MGLRFICARSFWLTLVLGFQIGLFWSCDKDNNPEEDPIVLPSITAVSYNATTAKLSVKGVSLGEKIDPLKIFLGLEGAEIAITKGAFAGTATEQSITFSADTKPTKAEIAALFDKNGKESIAKKIYNLKASKGFSTTNINATDAQNAVMVVGVATVITSVSYNALSGRLTVKGSYLETLQAVKASIGLTGAEVAITKGTFSGTATEQSLVFSADTKPTRVAINAILDKTGLKSSGGKAYQLKAVAGFSSVSPAAVFAVAIVTTEAYVPIAKYFVEAKIATDAVAKAPHSGVSKSEFSTIAMFLKGASGALPIVAPYVKIAGFIDEGTTATTVSVHEITYRTHFNGAVINASGILALPDGDIKGIVSIQHGTTIEHARVPTKLVISSATVMAKAIDIGDIAGNLLEFAQTAFALQGYVVLMPDYIGFGASESVFHPYIVREPSADCVVDFIFAAREYLKSKGKTVKDNKLFLTGYSEGGFVTLAAQQRLEALGEKVTASAPAAGPYDLDFTRKVVFDQDTYDNMYYLPYMVKGYKTAGVSVALEDFILPAKLTGLPALLNGMKTGGDINDHLGDQVKEVVVADALHADKYAILEKFKPFREALKSNSLHEGWTVKAPTRFYHHDRDEYVNHRNSQSAATNLGANATLVPLTETISSGSVHVGAYPEYFLEAFKWFKTF